MKSLVEYLNSPRIYYEYDPGTGRGGGDFLAVEEKDGQFHYFVLLDRNDEPIPWEKIRNSVRSSIGSTVLNNGSIFGVEPTVIALVRGCHAIGEVGTNNRGIDVGNICSIFRNTDSEWNNYTR